MTIEQLRIEAEKLGYVLRKAPNYDCSCHAEYPNRGDRWQENKVRQLCADRVETAELSFVRNALQEERWIKQMKITQLHRVHFVRCHPHSLRL